MFVALFADQSEFLLNRTSVQPDFSRLGSSALVGSVSIFFAASCSLPALSFLFGSGIQIRLHSFDSSFIQP
ncbi:MAG: hypothetical protein DCF24_08915 [Cyanobium sp.]|nr:MAG: hypothetical protein DCF24_08915 [Cyanobium sp.]